MLAAKRLVLREKKSLFEGLKLTAELERAYWGKAGALTNARRSFAIAKKLGEESKERVRLASTYLKAADDAKRQRTKSPSLIGKGWWTIVGWGTHVGALYHNQVFHFTSSIDEVSHKDLYGFALALHKLGWCRRALHFVEAALCTEGVTVNEEILFLIERIMLLQDLSRPQEEIFKALRHATARSLKADPFAQVLLFETEARFLAAIGRRDDAVFLLEQAVQLARLKNLKTQVTRLERFLKNK